MTNPQSLLRETFEAHEHIAPSASGLAAYAQSRAKKQRTIERWSVAAGVAVCAVAAVGVFAVTQRPSSDAGPIASPSPSSTTTHPNYTGWACPPKAVVTVEWNHPPKSDLLMFAIQFATRDYRGPEFRRITTTPRAIKSAEPTTATTRVLKGHLTVALATFVRQGQHGGWVADQISRCPLPSDQKPTTP